MDGDVNVNVPRQVGGAHFDVLAVSSFDLLLRLPREPLGRARLRAVIQRHAQLDVHVLRVALGSGRGSQTRREEQEKSVRRRVAKGGKPL